MSKPTLPELIRGEWHLLLILVLVLAAVPVFAFRGKSGPQAEPIPSRDSQALMAQPRSPNASAVRPTEARATDQDLARKTIAEHQDKLDADPKAEDAPALLSAMGNLYRQKLLDYQQAAGCFERLITDYPQWPSIRDAHLQLVVCYDRLGDLESRSRVLRRIMSDFPPESEEYRYASQELGIVSTAPEVSESPVPVEVSQ